MRFTGHVQQTFGTLSSRLSGVLFGFLVVLLTMAAAFTAWDYHRQIRQVWEYRLTTASQAITSAATLLEQLARRTDLANSIGRVRDIGQALGFSGIAVVSPDETRAFPQETETDNALFRQLYQEALRENRAVAARHEMTGLILAAAPLTDSSSIVTSVVLGQMPSGRELYGLTTGLWLRAAGIIIAWTVFFLLVYLALRRILIRPLENAEQAAHVLESGGRPRRRKPSRIREIDGISGVLEHVAAGGRGLASDDWEQKFLAMLEVMSDPAFICSGDRVVEYMNPAMIRRIGGNAAGQSCRSAVRTSDGACPWCGEVIEWPQGTAADGRQPLILLSTTIRRKSGGVSKVTVLKDEPGPGQAENPGRTGEPSVDNILHSVSGR